jgi:DNA-binding CsgD family transcriptional regulator/PAS domain-containing protein
VPVIAGARNNAVLPQVVESVYDCIAEPCQWPDTLGAMCRLAGGCMATLGVVDTAANAARLLMTYGDPQVIGPLMNEYAAEVSFFSALPRMEIDVPFTVDLVYELQGPSARQTWIDSRIAREWVIPNRLDDFFWVALMKQPARVGTLMIITDKDRPQITGDDLDTVSLLAPHVRRAVTIGDMFDGERRATTMFRQIVESLAHPVLIVSADMQILFSNAAAETLLAEGAAVSSLRGQLAFTYPQADAAVSRAVALGTRDEFALGPSGINVPLARAGAPAVAHVMPLARRDPSQRVASRAAAAIFIAAAGSGPLPALDAIAALFGLTAAEKRVAGHVAEGRSRGEIAASSGVSDGTVKSQLAAIYDKTGTSDQRELQLLIHELSPPVTSN